jgi:hypothetical protein
MGEEEAEALRGVVDAMDLQPALFDSLALADEDEGQDPNKLETSLLRDRLDHHSIYLALAAQAEEVAGVMADTHATCIERP